MPSRRSLAVALIVSLVVLMAGRAVAAPIAIEPDAKPIFDRVVTHYQKVPGIETSVEMRLQMTGPMAQDVTSRFEMRAAKPNLMLLTHTSGELGMDIASNGIDYLVHLPMMHRYTVEPTAPTMEGLVKKITMTGGSQGGAEMTLPLMFMAADPTQALGMHFLNVRAMGSERVGQETLDRLRFEAQDLAIDVWVQADGEPWVRQVKPDYTKLLEQIKAQGGGEMSIDLSIKYANARSVQHETTAFMFTPPKTSKRAETLMDTPEVANSADGPQGLIGRLAPPIQLKRLNGEMMKLSQHRGKDIVVLDFWATWCGPCKRGLPIIDKVTKSFADQNVVFYSVNLQEKPDVIKAEMEKQGWSFPVLMDDGNVIGHAYRARSIPQTVIISKDGIVEQVHVGFSRELEQTLTAELEKLISGQCLHEGHHHHHHHGHDHGHGHDHSGHDHGHDHDHDHDHDHGHIHGGG